MRLWSLDDPAASHGIERTVAFEHLEMLVAAGLAAKQTLQGGRGRPRNAYRYAAAQHEPSRSAQRSRLLADLLARSLSMIPDGAEHAHDVGREFGRDIGSLGRLGGEYLIDDRSVHALSCLFE